MDPTSYAAASRLSLSTSVIIVYVLALVVPAVGAIMAMARARRMLRRARRAHADFAAKARLAPGHATLLGTVETLGDEPAVRLTIHQLPRAYRSRNSSGIRWTELRRDVEARPFDLVLDSGERVRVRASDAVRLCDPLGAPVAGGAQGERTRSTTIENGERIHAVGVVSRERDESGATAGYRGGGTSWVLAATKRERLILSKTPFDAIFRQKERFSTFTAGAILLGLVVTHLALADFHRLNVRGEVVAAHDLSASTYTSRTKNGTLTHYRVAGTAVVGGSAVPVCDETNFGIYSSVKGGVGGGGGPGARGTLGSVPFVVDGSADVPDQYMACGSFAQIGRQPGISLVAAMFVVFALAGGAFAFLIARRRSLLWWEKKLVVDVEPNR